jgi:hypothetical protein
LTIYLHANQDALSPDLRFNDDSYNYMSCIYSIRFERLDFTVIAPHMLPSAADPFVF